MLQIIDRESWGSWRRDPFLVSERDGSREGSGHVRDTRPRLDACSLEFWDEKRKFTQSFGLTGERVKGSMMEEIIRGSEL